jgi:hypothetical protein
MRFSLTAQPNELKVNSRADEKIFNEFTEPRKFHPTELLAQLLKRQSRSVLHDITVCAPHLIALHIQRGKDLCELIDLSTAHGFLQEHERLLSGLQMAKPSTVIDFRACLDHALQYHRSPISVSNDEVINRLDLIAWQLSRLNSAHSSNQIPAGNNNGGAK